MKPARGDTELRIVCPSCEDRDQKCYVNPEKKVFNCFHCGFSSKKFDAISFVSKTEGITKMQAIKNILQELEVVTPVGSAFETTVTDRIYGGQNMKKQRHILRSIDGLPAPCKLIDPGQSDAWPFLTYLYDRGLTLEEIVDMQVHYVPEANYFLYVCGASLLELQANGGRYRPEIPQLPRLRYQLHTMAVQQALQ